MIKLEILIEEGVDVVRRQSPLLPLTALSAGCWLDSSLEESERRDIEG